MNRSPLGSVLQSVETKGGAELADVSRLGALRKAVPIFIGAVMRSIRAAEETGFYLHDVYGPTKEIMLCHLEPSSSSFW